MDEKIQVTECFLLPSNLWVPVTLAIRYPPKNREQRRVSRETAINVSSLTVYIRYAKQRIKRERERERERVALLPLPLMRSPQRFETTVSRHFSGRGPWSGEIARFVVCRPLRAQRRGERRGEERRARLARLAVFRIDACTGVRVRSRA